MQEEGEEEAEEKELVGHGTFSQCFNYIGRTTTEYSTTELRQNYYRATLPSKTDYSYGYGYARVLRAAYRMCVSTEVINGE